MNPKTTIILLIVFAFVCGALLMLPTGPQPPPIEEDVSSKPLYLDDELGPSVAVLRIFTSTDRQPDLVLVKKNARWWVSHPHLFPANRRVIDELLSTLAGIQATPVGLETDAQPDDVSGQRGITIEYTDRPSLQIGLSERSGAGRGRIHSRLDLLETDDTLHDYFDTFRPADFYAKKVDVPIMPEIEKIGLTSLDESSSLIQKDAHWLIGDDQAAERALFEDLPDAPSIKQLFTVLDLLELTDLQPLGTPLAAYGLEQPIASITLTPLRDALAQADNDITINLGVPADPGDTLRYVSVSYDKQAPPAVFTASTRYALLLGQSAKSFRDPRIISIPIALVESLVMSYPNRANARLDIGTGKGGTLTMASDGLTAISQQQCASLLKRLSESRASAYIQHRFDEADPLAHVELIVRFGGTGERFAIYRDTQSEPNEPTVLIRRGDESIALRMPREAVTGLLTPSALITEDND